MGAGSAFGVVFEVTSRWDSCCGLGGDYDVGWALGLQYEVILYPVLYWDLDQGVDQGLY